MDQATSEVGGSAPPPPRGSAVPVAVDIGEPTAAAVRSWCEGTLGWQVVDGDGTDPVPPVVRLVDHLAGGPGPMGRVDPREATILLLPDGVEAADAADAARRLQPVAVLRWPSQRDGLPELVDQVVAAGRHRHGGVPCLLVGGSAGGVGTTTVALALGGLRAWAGTPTLVGVRGSGLTPRAVPIAGLGAADLWAAADPRPGVPGLRAVRLLDHGPVPGVVDPSVGSVVLDAGVSTEVDVLVCRLDRAGVAALELTSAAATIVVGEPLLPQRTIRTVLDGRAVVSLPWSARVARAALRDRVPADLPGSFLTRLHVAATGSAARETPADAGRRRRGRGRAHTGVRAT